jgi:hypothetical protein
MIIQVEVEVVLRPTVSRPLRLGVVPPIGKGDQMMRGLVCNLQFNDASSSYIAADGQSASSSWCRAPWPDFNFLCLTVTFFLFRVGRPRPYPPWTGWSSPKSKSKVSHVSVGRNFLILQLRLLDAKHALQRGIWVPTQHLLLDQGKPRKTLNELAGRRTFPTQTDF